MGIGIFFTYVPALIVLLAITFPISLIPLKMTYNIDPEKGTITTLYKVCTYLSGSILTLLISAICAWRYFVQLGDGWEPIIGSLAISLLGPTSIGMTLFVVWWLFFRKRKTIFNYFVSGALQSIIIPPSLGIVALKFL